MAKGRVRDLDWITVRYKDIFALIGVLVAVVAIGGGAFIYWRWHGNPQIQAERALTRAERMIETMDTPNLTAEVRATINQARNMLNQGRAEYQARHYPKALSIAKDVLATLKNIQIASPSAQKYAVLVDTEGSVEVKRTGQHLFSGAKEQMILEDGDIVRTGQNSYAKIKYHNGQVQIVNPDSLVVIQVMFTTSDGANRIEVALKQGFVETQTPKDMTPKDESIIATESTKVRPAPASRVGVAQTASGQVVTSVYSGSTEIEAAGQKETVEAGVSGASIITTSSGFSPRETLIAPPSAEYPKDQQVLRVDDPVRQTINFEWTGGTSKAEFQISAKPLFSKLLAPDQLVTGGKITVDGLPAGTYYWRVRSEGPQKKTYWSPIYRFRLLQIYQRPKIKRDIKLTVDVTPIGDGVIIQGSTDPGVSVSVNDIEIPVNTDGTFSKIFLFSDVGTQTVQVRAFDDEGNEKIWRKQFQSVAY